MPIYTYENCTDCCEGVEVWYRQARTCNGIAADLWKLESELSLPTPYYFRVGSICYYFNSSSNRSLTPGPILGAHTVNTGCSSSGCPALDGGGCCSTVQGTPQLIRAIVSGATLCTCSSSGDLREFQGANPSGSFLLVHRGGGVSVADCRYGVNLGTYQDCNCSSGNPINCTNDLNVEHVASLIGGASRFTFTLRENPRCDFNREDFCNGLTTGCNLIPVGCGSLPAILNSGSITVQIVDEDEGI